MDDEHLDLSAHIRTLLDIVVNFYLRAVTFYKVYNIYIYPFRTSQSPSHVHVFHRWFMWDKSTVHMFPECPFILHEARVISCHLPFVWRERQSQVHVIFPSSVQHELHMRMFFTCNSCEMSQVYMLSTSHPYDMNHLFVFLNHCSYDMGQVHTLHPRFMWDESTWHFLQQWLVQELASLHILHSSFMWDYLECIR